MGESHQELLLSLKTVVEGLLSSQVLNVWNVYGGLSRLHQVLERILKHGCSVFKQNGEEDCWIFIEGLNWIQPSLATFPTPVNIASPPPHQHTDRAMIWLHNSLETHTLSEKLLWLLSDEGHLRTCYHPLAYLRQSQYAEATIICLRAVEQYQPGLLTEIHPSLYLSRRLLRVASDKSHRRCSSYPEVSLQGYLSGCWLPGGTMTTELSMISAPSAERQKSAVVIPSPSSTPVISSIRSSPPVSAESSLISSRSEVKPDVAPEHGRRPKHSVSFSKNCSNYYRERLWKSLPSLTEMEVTASAANGSEPSSLPSTRRCIVESKTEPSSPHKLSPSVLKIDYSDLQRTPASVSKGESYRSRKTSRRPSTTGAKAAELGPLTDDSGESVEMSSRLWPPPLPPRLTLPSANERNKRRSFLEAGGTGVQPMSTGFFPQPRRGQSLIGFLSSAQFARTSAQLDRENAHFSISEGVISVIEQLKCKRLEQLADEVFEESDEEIQELKQRIRLRRRQKQQERRHHAITSAFFPASSASSTQPFSDTTTNTDQSFSPLSSPSDSGSSESLSTEGVEDLEVDKVTNMEEIKNAGMSLSMASLYSEADLSRPQSNGDCLVSSAESVAISLLRKFSDKRLPRASDIEWLVSEKEAPQQLLPMPTSWAVSSDDAELEESFIVVSDGGSTKSKLLTTPLRGTSQWAPPRPQIIFTTHPPPKRKELMQKQQLRCAGCGVKVLPEYANRFRYCDYLGRYFCTGCHSSKQAIIPGRILSKWDYSRYSVSDFSFNLLEQIWTDPLFSVEAINRELYKRIKALEKCRNMRRQLYYIKDFLVTCRFAQEQKEALRKEPEHMFKEPDKYSLQDFVQVRSGELNKRLSHTLAQASLHVAECQLCQARGFVCELCKSGEVIFPWELWRVTRCDGCGTCHHTACIRQCSGNSRGASPVVSEVCPRCARIRVRDQQRVSENEATAR